jgi:hypothetical protein
MARSSTCPFCGGVDSWKHSLIECDMAVSVWALENEMLVEHMITCGETHAWNWLFLLEVISIISRLRGQLELC